MPIGWLTEKINKRKVLRETPRNYIGASLIGSECLRQIWYDFKGAPSEPIDAKLQRTFDVGKKLEDLVLDWLEDAGLPIVRPNKVNNYLGFVSSDLSYFKGHADALLLKPRAVIEIKTAKDSRFRLLKKQGLLVWSPLYYAQIQSYMGMSRIDKAFIVVFNKDTSELYDELIEFDPVFYDDLKLKAEMVDLADEPPPRINESPLWFKCKLCRFKKVCHT